ncbi:MAG: zinc ribbon domain-containing protein [Candidatus Aminicenantes bacterium]|nr:MAG: zinc ribbon domain-containing protein [Candidatus Aminicenantes bacterium]
MIFIGGVQPRTVRLEKVARACPSCSHFEICLKRVDHYIALFFIPLIRIKKGVPFLVCENCGTLPGESGSAFEFREAGQPRQCGFCGRTVEADFFYCPYCGKSL